MNQQNEKNPVILDNGSGFFKAGFSGEENLRTYFPSLIGKSKADPFFGIESQSFVGEEALSKRCLLKFIFPIQKGVITSWEDIEKIWNHCYLSELRVHPEEHPVLLTEAPLNPIINREKTTLIMFETYNIPSFYLASQSVLSLYAYGKTTGLVLDSGEGVSNAVPIFEGYSIYDSITNLDLNGKDLTEYMRKLLTEVGIELKSFLEIFYIAKDVKEKACYVAYDFNTELKSSQTSSKEITYTLPDGQEITIGSQAFRCGELLFQPKVNNKEISGIHEMVFRSIEKSSEENRKVFYENIVLSGGNTMYNGVAERLKKELKTLDPSTNKINVDTSPQGNLLAWKGGSILSSLSSFENQWINKDEYDEIGPTVVHRKCCM